MNLVFADAAYFIAHFNNRDQYHRKAVALSERFSRLVTSEWVLLEVADGFAATHQRRRIHQLFYLLRNSPLSEVVPVSSALLDQALELYHERDDKQWTLTDCTSFIIMRERGIKEALTGDRHFEQAGFTALLK
ncbi:MAG TPA: PIN domain-containing protein [Candidatus Methylacidiphilales bacterium]|jgi:predicted nucleic acid-binding protein|nr:PIN domain-containing protein [Candidatus Methylacidiphilales bacterium]